MFGSLLVIIGTIIFFIGVNRFLENKNRCLTITLGGVILIYIGYGLMSGQLVF